jgi:sulfite reductase alpha subunit
MWMEGGKLMIDTKECTRCMHCINVMPRALHIGDDRGIYPVGRRQGPHSRRRPDGLADRSVYSAEAPYDEIKEKSSSRSGIGGWKKARTASGSAS